MFFLRHLIVRMIILPSQARDKHRENSKKKSGVSVRLGGFLGGGGTRLPGDGPYVAWNPAAAPLAVAPFGEAVRTFAKWNRIIFNGNKLILRKHTSSRGLLLRESSRIAPLSH